MHELASWIMDRSMGSPGPDGHWPAGLSVAFHGSNLVAACAQTFFLVVVAAKWKYRRDGVSPWLFWSVLLFLPLTALSRFGRVLEYFGPPYHLVTILDCLVAAGTVYSDFWLPRFVDHTVKLARRSELHAALNVAHLERVSKELAFAEERARNAKILAELDAACAIIKDEVWKQETRQALDALARATSLLKREVARDGPV